MPSPNQLALEAQTPGMRFLIWTHSEAEDPCHVMFSPSSNCAYRLRSGWRLLSEERDGASTFYNRWLNDYDWREVNYEAFCRVMTGPKLDRHDKLFKTNHKLGVPKGKIP